MFTLAAASCLLKLPNKGSNATEATHQSWPFDPRYPVPYQKCPVFPRFFLICSLLNTFPYPIPPSSTSTFSCSCVLSNRSTFPCSVPYDIFLFPSSCFPKPLGNLQLRSFARTKVPQRSTTLLHKLNPPTDQR